MKGRFVMRERVGKGGDRRLRREDGAAAVEFAIVSVLLFMIVFGIIQFGVFFERYEALVSAAREGGRTAAVDGTTAQIQSAVVVATPFTINCLAGSGASCVTVTPGPGGASGTSCNSTNHGANVSVSVAYTWTPFFPFPPVPSSFTTQGVFRCE
jgi:Flp pilus assembly protein TadG